MTAALRPRVDLRSQPAAPGPPPAAGRVDLRSGAAAPPPPPAAGRVNLRSEAAAPPPAARRADLRSESGTMLLWMLMVVLMTLFLGGIAVDLWRAFSERRAVAGMVDAAAIAGASGIDADRYRATNEVVLDPVQARTRALANLAQQGEDLPGVVVEVAPDGSAITVTGTRDVPFTLMRVLLPDLADARVAASAVSTPVLDDP